MTAAAPLARLPFSVRRPEHDRAGVEQVLAQGGPKRGGHLILQVVIWHVQMLCGSLPVLLEEPGWVRQPEPLAAQEPAASAEDSDGPVDHRLDWRRCGAERQRSDLGQTEGFNVPAHTRED